MLHSNLTVNGKKLSNEKELEAFLDSQNFSCEIEDAALEVEMMSLLSCYVYLK